MTRKILIVTALVAGVAATADAQLCAGNAPFTAGRMRVGLGAEFPDGAKTYGGDLTWSHSSGAYIGAAVSRYDDSNSDVSAMDYAGNLGYELSSAVLGKVRFCPTGHFGIRKGPDAGNTELSETHYGVGGAFGGVLSASDNMAIVPSLGVHWVHASDKTTTRTNNGSTSTTVTDSWMEATLGAGFVINRDVTFAPMVRIPLNQDGGESRFGFSVSYNFGRSGGVMQQGGRRRR
jgi:hypothetical protein